MTGGSIVENYIRLRENVNESVLKLNLETNRLSLGRLVSFAIGVIALTIGLVDSKAAAAILGIVGLIVFFILVVISYKKNDMLQYERALLSVYDRYIARFNDDWKEFDDDGVEFLDASDSYVKEVAMDLDLLGEDSLYQYINVCGSYSGKEKLYKYLTLAFSDRAVEDSSSDRLDKIFMTSKIAICERQEAVRELVSLDEVSYKLEALIIRALNRSKKALLKKVDITFDNDDKERGFTVFVAIMSLLLICAAW